MKIATVSLIVVSLVASFAQADQQSTVKSRWEIIGITDASYGHQLRTEFDLTPFGRFTASEYETYRTAYLQTLTKNCNPNTAFQQGLKGMAYAGQCAGMDNEDAIVSRWVEGLKQSRYSRLMYTSTD